MKPVPTALGIAIVDPATSWNYLTQHEQELVLASGIRWVSVRLRSKNIEPLARQVIAAGLELRGHDWDGESNGDTDPDTRFSTAAAETGYKDGVSAARRALGVLGGKLTRYEANLEWELWKGVAGFANPQADEYIQAFWQGFRDTAGDRFLLDYLGFFDPTKFYKASDADHDGRPDNAITDFIKGIVGDATAMIYASNPPTIVRELARARRVWGDKLRGVYASPGAIDARGAVVGCWAQWKKVIIARQVDELTFYIGNTVKGRRVQAWQMLAQGHAMHPSILDIARRHGIHAR